MKFRLSVQRPEASHKFIAPSHLLSDPAFSPDPHSNPYFVDSREPAWATSPPVGHPVLKHNQRIRRPLANFATDGTITSADFDFQLIQPPNSPVSILGGSGSHDYPFPSTLHTVGAGTPSSRPTAPFETTASSSLHTRTVPQSAAPSALSSATSHPSAAKEPKRKRMPFLSRRKTSPPAEAYESQNINPKSRSAFVSPTTSYDVTQDGRPAAASRFPSEPIIPQSGERPVIPARAVTTGADTPRSTASSSTAMSSKRRTDGFSGRTKDLDKIDELDETNPWGIALHHGGPYEAAVKALRHGANDMPLGVSNGGFGDYHSQAMKAHGHAYVPPQAPIGVSLNLKPGQILSRNFQEKRNPPRMREGTTLPPRMQAALSQSNTSPTPSLYRSQSHAVPPSQSSAYNPHPANRMASPPEINPESVQYRRQSHPVPTSPFSSSYPNPHPIIEAEPRSHIQRDPRRGQQPDGFSVNPPLVPTETPGAFTGQSESQTHIASQPSASSNYRVQPPPIFIETGNLRSKSEPEEEEDEEVGDEDEDEEDESDEQAPFDIGMAMLRSEPSETLSIPSPRIYLPPGTPDHELEFDPYDPVHLEKGHSRSPSPLVVLYARSDRSYDTSHEPSLASHGSSSHESSYAPYGSSTHSHESSRGPSREPPRVVSQQPQLPPPRAVSQQSQPPLPRAVSQHSQLPPPHAISQQSSNLTSNVPSQPSQPPSHNSSRSVSAGPRPAKFRVRNPEPSTVSQYQERDDDLKKAPLPLQQGGHPEDPPPYNAILAVEHVSRVLSEQFNDGHARHQSQAFPRSDSPNSAPSWRSRASSDDSHHSRRQGRPSAPISDNTFIPPVPALPQQGPVPPPSDFKRGSQPVVDSLQRVSQDSMRPMLSPRRSRERLLTPATSSLDHGQQLVQPPQSTASLHHQPERDARSMHPSVSTHSSSGQTGLTNRSGPPPPHRRVPKHLVMPAPLVNSPNGNPSNGTHGMTSPPPRMNGMPLPPRMNGMMASPPPRAHYPPPSSLLAPRHASVQFQPHQQVQTYYPQPAPQPAAIKPSVAVAPRAQEIPVAVTGKKLKKRASVMPPPTAPTGKAPPVPMMTVSFAPPIVGYGSPMIDQKSIARSKTEKIPKRVLSKKRTDI